tara:strand:- start:207 stop:425 length:219 start_codon:yes stop_codon:yes gene_type:complete
MSKEITSKLLRKYISIKGTRISYNKNTETIRITNKDPEVIYSINQWLLNYFPHYLSNIDYGENWLQIISIRN